MSEALGGAGGGCGGSHDVVALLMMSGRLSVAAGGVARQVVTMPEGWRVSVGCRS